MSDSTSRSLCKLTEALAQLRARCLDMGLPAWTLSGAGTIIATPDLSAPERRWLRSATIEQRLLDLTRAWLEQDGDMEPAELFPGATALPLPTVGPTVVEAVTVALHLDDSALQSDVFSDACAEVWVDPAETAAALAEMLNDTQDPAHLHPLLQTMHEDLRELGAHRFAVHDLSQQLTNTYEQISALYTLGRSMNCISEPLQFARATCEQVHYLLDFSWVAVQYSNDRRGLAQCRGELVIHADDEMDSRTFSRHALQMLDQLDPEHWQSVHDTTESELAAWLGTQIVAAPVMHDDALIGMIIAGGKRGHEREVSSVDTQLLDVTSDYLSVFHQNVSRFEVQRSLFMGTVRAMTSAIDAKDRYTRGHSERVARLSSKLGAAIGLGESEQERIYIAGLLHDVGKIGVPETVLCKPGRLTDDEFELIKRHPIIGFDILRDIPSMRDMLPGVLYHHERWDGLGYPHGLAGEDIPILGRIIAVADAFDAMSSDRSYRSRLTRDDVLAEFAKGAGSQWDAKLVDAFLALDLSDYDHMIADHAVREQRAA